MEKGKVKKVVNLCFLLLIGFIYLIFTSTVPLSVTEGLVIAKLACEILSIVLGIGGGFLIYNNIYTKINYRANFMAYTLLGVSVLILMGMKYYRMCPFRESKYGDYQLYRFIMEWIQFIMLILCIRVIRDEDSLGKWTKIEAVIMGITGLFTVMNFKVLYDGLRLERIQIVVHIVCFILMVSLFRMNYKMIDQMRPIEGNLFKAMFGIKIVTCLMGLLRIVLKCWQFQLSQYILQIIFMVFVVWYIDEVTLGSTWAKIERGMRGKVGEVKESESDQKLMISAVDQIVTLIHKMNEGIEALDGCLEVDENGKKHLGRIRKSSNRLLRLSSNILELNDCEMGKWQINKEYINLSQLIKELVDASESYVKQKGITLTYEADKEAIWGSVDQNAIERIFLNLISNAVKYNRESGSIRVILNQKKKRIFLCVQDSGIGIPSDDLEEIFNKYKRVDSKEASRQEGSGLGLSIVKSLVDMHRGEIKILSKEGKGTLISVELPQNQYGEISKIRERPSKKADVEERMQMALSGLKR